MRCSLGQLASRFAPSAYQHYINHEMQRRRDRIARSVALDGTTLLDDGQFDRLMARKFPRAAAYDYDLFSSTARAAARLSRLAELFPMLKRPCEVLEVSCGDGLVGSLIAQAQHEVVLADVRDWRSAPARHLNFVNWDVCTKTESFRDRFDLVLAYNATEHWEDPGAALSSLLAVCKVGGFVLLEFGPLFNSPWGLHAWSIGFPYPQFLFSRQLIKDKVQMMGVQDLGTEGTSLQPTNGWSIAAFRQLWARCGAEIVLNVEDRDYRYLDFIEEFAGCYRGRNLSFDDLTVNSIEIVLQKI